MKSQTPLLVALAIVVALAQPVSAEEEEISTLSSGCTSTIGNCSFECVSLGVATLAAIGPVGDIVQAVVTCQSADNRLHVPCIGTLRCDAAFVVPPNLPYGFCQILQGDAATCQSF